MHLNTTSSFNRKEGALATEFTDDSVHRLYQSLISNSVLLSELAAHSIVADKTVTQ